MSDFFNRLEKAAGKAAKGIGNAILDSVESDARRCSKDNRFSENQRSQYAEVESSIKKLRSNGSKK